MDQMVYHTRIVSRAAQRAHVVGDMPFMSYQASVDEAVRNAGRLVAEGGAEAVKLEGGAEFAEVIAKIVRAGIPVMGHIGLTPQTVHKMGGYVVQGRDEEKAQRLLEDAKALEAAGCYSIVLEGIPQELGAQITAALSIPTIGIGAGPHCDGQVLVIYDLLGMDPSFSPKFVKRYAQLHDVIGGAVREYLGEVKGGAFPDDAHSFRMAPAKAKAEIPAATNIRVVEGEEKLGAIYGGVAADGTKR
jgi:3-methyl-2-oxobutanoate hydroxymethyltransferase